MTGAVRTVREEAVTGVPAVAHPEWSDVFPWLVQGTTTRGDSGEPFDLRLFGSDGSLDGAARGAVGRWERLRRWSGLRGVVHARQIHGSHVRVHPADAAHERGARTGVGAQQEAEHMSLVGACDGHLTTAPDLLLAVSIADCVPVSIVDPRTRRVALLHAGWRGAAAGILEEGLACLARLGTGSASVHVHLGPSICGRCYEVGGEVFEALGCPRPHAPEPIDLPGVLARRALDAGVAGDRVTRSAHCTRCGEGGFFSHRGGDGGRQVSFLGVRP